MHSEKIPENIHLLSGLKMATEKTKEISTVHVWSELVCVCIGNLWQLWYMRFGWMPSIIINERPLVNTHIVDKVKWHAVDCTKMLKWPRELTMEIEEKSS